VGIAEEASQKPHLIALPPTAMVLPLNNIRRRGGYATIRRVHIKGAQGIKPWWEFVARLSNQSQTQLDLVKMEHQKKIDGNGDSTCRCYTICCNPR
jgi:hypothetical protein